MSLRILLTAWPMWSVPLAYGGPSCSTNSGAPRRASRRRWYTPSLVPLLDPARLALGQVAAHRERRVGQVQRGAVVGAWRSCGAAGRGHGGRSERASRRAGCSGVGGATSEPVSARRGAQGRRGAACKFGRAWSGAGRRVRADAPRTSARARRRRGAIASVSASSDVVARFVAQLVQQFDADESTVAAFGAERGRPVAGSAPRAARGRCPPPSAARPGWPRRAAARRPGHAPGTTKMPLAAGCGWAKRRFSVRKPSSSRRWRQPAPQLAAVDHVAADAVRAGRAARRPPPCRRRPAPRAPPSSTRACRALRSCSCARRRSPRARRRRRAWRSRRRAWRRSGNRRRPARSARPGRRTSTSSMNACGRQRGEARVEAQHAPPGRCRSARVRPACRAAWRCAPAPARACRRGAAK